jgi:signal transduction histidine kinase
MENALSNGTVPAMASRSSAPKAFESTSDILVVDDTPENLVAIEAALTGLATNLVMAQSGPEALRCLLQNDFALILLDVQMPSMDGLETARMIRGRERTRHVPIIFVTAHDRNDDDVLAAYRLGAVDFLFKPVDAEVLRAKASVFVELQRRTAEVARQSILLQNQERAMHERALSEQRRRIEADALRARLLENERLAKELARKNEELRGIQAKLEETNARLAQDDRRKDEFIAVLAHELRNPLTPIVAGLHLMEGPPDSTRDLSRVRGAMQRQISHLVRLVDDLLDVSRITSGKIELCREQVRMRDVIAQAAEISQPFITQRNHTLSSRIEAGDVVVHGDPVRLAQVISNLLNNAARYTDPGGRIELTCREENGSIRIDVSDTGRGMGPELLPRVFDIFVQEKAGGGGLGIGLTLVRRLTEMHGGRVQASSEGPGKGATFSVWLPRATGNEPTELIEPERELSMLPGRALRIVLIEDNDDIRATIGEVLSRWGHQVFRAPTGEEGLSIIMRERPDLALVDIGLPDMEGYEVASRARATLAEACPRLVALSGFGQGKDRVRSAASGFDEHLAKPVTGELLQRVLIQPRVNHEN